MYAITGITGHVGGATAHALRAADQPVRAVVRDPGRAASWPGAAVADLTDQAALTAALTGCRGAFVLLPTIATGGDAEHRAMADTIAAAVADSGVPHVVMLSSWGAHRAEGTGPIRWLHHLENRLGATGAVVTAVRAPHFQEKAEEILGAATGAGVYPVFGDTADVPVPMVATRDIGRAVADALVNPPAASEVVALEAPAYTERQAAELLGELLGRELDVVTVPQPAWLDTMIQAGVPPMLATELTALYDAGNRGLLEPRGDRRRECATELKETLQEVVRAARAGGRS